MDGACRTARRATLGVVLAVLAGCTSTTSAPVVVSGDGAPTGGLRELVGTSVGDVIRRPALSLLDTAGQHFGLTTRPSGRLTMLFFGYTRCPDVCPTTMADLAAARRLLTPQQRARVEVAFVTEDPQRDQPPVLRAWLDRFDTSFIGLIGGGQRTADALGRLKAPASAVRTKSGNVEHAGSVYAFIGEQVVVYTGGTTPGQFATDMGLLLQQA